MTSCGREENDAKDKGGDDDTDYSEDNTVDSDGRKICYKCKDKTPAVMIGHDKTCRDCMGSVILHKLKLALRLSINLQKGDRVLVAFSGGPNSLALLHMMMACILPDPVTSRRMVFQFEIAHIDECCLLDLTADERKSIRQEVMALCAPYKVAVHTRGIEEAFNLGIELPKTVSGDQKDVKDLPSGQSSEFTPAEQKIRKLFDSVPDVADKADLLEFLTLRLLADTAARNGFRYILCGESATRFAVKLIATTTKGRGFSLPFDVQSIDTRFGVQFVNPLRTTMSKALALYNRFQGLNAVCKPTFETLRDPFHNGGINLLTENFVLGLQEGFKSTVPNILRTCEKLKLPSKPKPQDQQKQDGKPATVGPKDNPAVPVMTATQTEKVCCLCGRSVDDEAMQRASQDVFITGLSKLVSLPTSALGKANAHNANTSDAKNTALSSHSKATGSSSISEVKSKDSSNSNATSAASGSKSQSHPGSLLGVVPCPSGLTCCHACGPLLATAPTHLLPSYLAQDSVKPLTLKPTSDRRKGGKKDSDTAAQSSGESSSQRKHRHKPPSKKQTRQQMKEALSEFILEDGHHDAS